MKIDYKLVDPPRKRRHPLRWLMAALLVGAPAVVALALVGDTPPESGTVRDSAVVQSAASLPPVQIQLVAPNGTTSEPVLAVIHATSEPEPQQPEVTPQTFASEDISTEPESTAQEDAPPERAWTTVTVESGDNLTRIFADQGLSARDVYKVLALGKQTGCLKRLHPGQELRLQVEDGNLIALEHDIDAFTQLQIHQNGDALTADVVEFDKDIRVTRTTGTIEDSLYLAGNRAGMSDKLIMELVQIFGWDINFWLDIRKGDRFAVIYQEVFRDGVKIRDGRILAAEFVNQNEAHRAVYYADEGNRAGYYDPNGSPMRKTFLRSPIKDAPVTSGFTLRRFHPILKTWRAHRGVDYGARTGTPIRSTGDGTITKIGWSNSYGKVVTIQHAGRYSTLYAHMSRFAPKLKDGSRVRQGQVIGYVGQTGLAKGAHLHFEFRVDGVHRDPQKVRFPKAQPLPKQQLAAFNTATQDLLGQLDALSTQMVAMNTQQHR
ncbi:MAG: peptidoglycan DD-metalloendopeptidase family protein [Gammaproteobacteria bacterium]|nr:peptidoglycan DD-metalloendopeptidase family protein [Gammaproteobacteria bacterium]MCP5137597.1 peptidoglycan DD-metalloendopeptidase family protein [Gammaproteobacteria bacterium]